MFNVTHWPGLISLPWSGWPGHDSWNLLYLSVANLHRGIEEGVQFHSQSSLLSQGLIRWNLNSPVILTRPNCSTLGSHLSLHCFAKPLKSWILQGQTEYQVITVQFIFQDLVVLSPCTARQVWQLLDFWHLDDTGLRHCQRAGNSSVQAFSMHGMFDEAEPRLSET